MWLDSCFEKVILAAVLEGAVLEVGRPVRRLLGVPGSHGLPGRREGVAVSGGEGWGPWERSFKKGSPTSGLSSEVGGDSIY